MSKTNTPFFGLEAHGSVGGSITAQGLSKGTLVRTKPLPTYRFTLAQAYQRWLYEDYAYLWRQQSAATQAEYRAAGVRFHLTGFQYWMKDMLTRLPDIAGWWKSDLISGITTPDSSKNTNTATIIGATHSDGIIDRCFLFDGINDYLACGLDPSLDLETQGSFESWVWSAAGNGLFMGTMQSMIVAQRRLAVGIAGGQFMFFMGNGAAGTATVNVGAFTASRWEHFILTWDSTRVKAYINGVNSYDQPQALIPETSGFPFTVGGTTFGGVGVTFPGYVDNSIAYNRVLDATEALRHSLRRYPP